MELLPWQTDTCIGSWHYARHFFEQHSYKKATDVIPMLADIVSKNGNLLLNIPVRGDGSIDGDEIAFLQVMAKWMAVNSEGIFNTRPWKIYGEGPSTTLVTGKGRSSDVSKTPFTAEDIRFTASKDGKILYAILLGWPDKGNIDIKSLARGAANYEGEVTTVQLSGSDENLAFSRDRNGLSVTLPKEKPCEIAYVLKITRGA